MFNLTTVPIDPKHKKKFGGFNDAPPNFKEITEEEFAKSSFFVYAPISIEYRQIHITNDVALTRLLTGGTYLYFFHDGTGYGICRDYSKGKVHYFSFAECPHTFRELKASDCAKKGISHYGNCWHVYECVTCGYVTSADSSD